MKTLTTLAASAILVASLGACSGGSGAAGGSSFVPSSTPNAAQAVSNAPEAENVHLFCAMASGSCFGTLPPVGQTISISVTDALVAGGTFTSSGCPTTLEQQPLPWKSVNSGTSSVGTQTFTTLRSSDCPLIVKDAAGQSLTVDLKARI